MTRFKQVMVNNSFPIPSKLSDTFLDVNISFTIIREASSVCKYDIFHTLFMYVIHFSASIIVRLKNGSMFVCFSSNFIVESQYRGSIGTVWSSMLSSVASRKNMPVYLDFLKNFIQIFTKFIFHIEIFGTTILTLAFAYS